MILADTSVWVEHFRKGKPELASALAEGIVLMHPAIAGELACGNLADRSEILRMLEALPRAAAATDSEALQIIDSLRLWGRGLGWVDAQILAAALLTNCGFWTLDRSLRDAARDAGVRCA